MFQQYQSLIDFTSPASDTPANSHARPHQLIAPQKSNYPLNKPASALVSVT